MATIDSFFGNSPNRTSGNEKLAENTFKDVKTDFVNFRKSSVVKTGNSFLGKFQDPTYLCFKIFFIGIGAATSGKKIGPNQNEPVINKTADSSFGKKLSPSQKGFTEPSTTNPYYDEYNTGLFGSIDNKNSALYYLNSIGDNARVKMLYDFISLLSEINTLYPWYFQQLDGLGEAWKRDYTKAKFKKELTIQCLESIDLRITGLMDLYRKIVYDWKNRRYILPENLRIFTMKVKVYDWRDFTVFPKIDRSSPGIATDKDGNSFVTANANYNREFLGAEKETERTQISFDFKFCQFEPDDSGTFMSSISNATPTMATQTIKISYQEIEECNIYRSLIALSDNPKFYFIKDYLNRELDILTSVNTETIAPTYIRDPQVVQQNSIGFEIPNIKDTLIGLGKDIASNISNRASNLVESRLNSLFLGNVYGFSPSTTIADPLGTVTKVASDVVRDKGGKQIGNVFDNF